MRHVLLGSGFPLWQTDGLLEEYAAWSQDEAARVTSDIQDATGQTPRSFEQFARLRVRVSLMPLKIVVVTNGAGLEAK